jgi:hypothetical protein
MFSEGRWPRTDEGRSRPWHVNESFVRTVRVLHAGGRSSTHAGIVVTPSREAKDNVDKGRSYNPTQRGPHFRLRHIVGVVLGAQSTTSPSSTKMPIAVTATSPRYELVERDGRSVPFLHRSLRCEFLNFGSSWARRRFSSTCSGAAPGVTPPAFATTRGQAAPDHVAAATCSVRPRSSRGPAASLSTLGRLRISVPGSRSGRAISRFLR